MARTLEEIMLDAVPTSGSRERDLRVVAAVLSYIAESVVRGDQIFVAYDAVLGGTDDDHRALLEYDETATSALWEHDGRDVHAELRRRGVDLTALGVVTIADMQPLIDDHVRAVLHDLPDRVIDEMVLECVRALGRSIDRGERHDDQPRAAERVVEDWFVAHLDQVAERCRLPRIELIRRQYRFANGKRADVVCRVTECDERCGPGMWVVFELKAGPLLPTDVDQVVGYLRAAEDELDVAGAGVLGCVVGDGAAPAVMDRIDELDEPVMCMDLVSVGFHAHLFEQLRELQRPGA